MGNKTGKFDVPKTDNDVKEKQIEVNAEHDEAVKEVKVETVTEAEPRENGDAAEVKEIMENAQEEKKETVNEEQKNENAEATTETKKKSMFGWLKKISFRKEKKPKSSKGENHEEIKEVKEEAKAEETAQNVITEEPEKVEETKPEESNTATVEEVKKDDEAKESEE